MKTYRKMKAWTILVGFISALVMVPLSGLAFVDGQTIGSQKQPQALQKITKTSENAQILFVVNAISGSLTPVKNDPTHYTLTLNGVHPTMVYFSDRPVRASGVLSLNAFMQDWSKGANSFANNAPNAALDAVNLQSKDGRHVLGMVVTLTHPVYNAAKQSMTFDAKVLRKSDKNLHKATFKYAALFIDGVHWNGNLDGVHWNGNL